jgi:hypothetical protein
MLLVFDVAVLLVLHMRQARTLFFRDGSIGLGYVFSGGNAVLAFV